MERPFQMNAWMLWCFVPFSFYWWDWTKKGLNVLSIAFGIQMIFVLFVKWVTYEIKLNHLNNALSENGLRSKGCSGPFNFKTVHFFLRWNHIQSQNASLLLPHNMFGIPILNTMYGLAYTRLLHTLHPIILFAINRFISLYIKIGAISFGAHFILTYTNMVHEIEV